MLVLAITLQLIRNDKCQRMLPVVRGDFAFKRTIKRIRIARIVGLLAIIPMRFEKLTQILAYLQSDFLIRLVRENREILSRRGVVNRNFQRDEPSRNEPGCDGK